MSASTPTALPDERDPIFAALDDAPEAEDDMSPEQRAEWEVIAAEYEAGRARLIPYENMPEALAEIARSRAA
jgi:hypothetical protein